MSNGQHNLFLKKTKKSRLGSSALIFLYSTNVNRAGKQIHAARKATTCFEFVFLLNCIFVFLPAFATIFKGIACEVKSKVVSKKVDADWLPEEFKSYQLNRSQDPECLSLTDVRNRVERNVFIPSKRHTICTLLCLTLLAWIILRKLRCAPPKIPESVWERWVRLIVDGDLSKIVFAITLGFLSIMYLELTSLSEILGEYHGKSGLTLRDISGFERSIALISSSLFGWLFYSKLENFERFLINFSPIVDAPIKRRFELTRSILSTKEIISITSGTAIVSLLAHFKLIAVMFEIGPMKYPITGVIRLTIWWWIMWKMCNFVYNLSHKRLSEEIHLPVNYYVYPNSRSLHLSDGMCITGDKECDVYLRHICVYEFYRISTTPSRVKYLFLLMNNRTDLPTGYENVMDASFFIVDTFRKLIQDWMECLKGAPPVFAKPKDLPEKESEKKSRTIRIGGDAYALGEPPLYSNPRINMRSLATKKSEGLKYLPNPNEVVLGPEQEVTTEQFLFVAKEYIRQNLKYWMGKLDKIFPIYTVLDIILNVCGAPFYLLYLVYNFIRTSIVHAIYNLHKKDENIKLLNIFQGGQFQIMSWTMAGLMEATCHSLIMDHNGISKLYIKQVIPCFVDLYETLTKALTILAENETFNMGGTDLKKEYMQKNHRYLKLLKHNCKFSLKKIHETFRDVYDLLEISMELEQKVLHIIH